MRLTMFAAPLYVLLATAAHATPITGTVSISGNDTFDSSHIAFSPYGSVYQASGTMSVFAPITVGSLTASYVATLKSFAFASPAGTVFSVTNNSGQTLSLSITSLFTQVIGNDVNGPTLRLTGAGNLFESGYDQTGATFTLASSSAGTMTGFQLVTTANVAATPEPSSLALLGTGLIGTIGLVRRRLGSA